MRISKEPIAPRSSSARVREGRVNVEPEDGASPEPEPEVPAKKARKRRASVDPSDKVRAKRSKDVTDPKRQRITVEGAGVIDPAAQAPQEASDALPLVIPATSADGQLVLPSRSDLELILAQADTSEKLVAVERMAAAIVDITRRCDHLRGQLAESVVFRLRSRHKLGLAIIQTVRPGGRRKKGRKGAPDEHGLPRNMKKGDARKCRELAKIPEPVMEEYFKAMAAPGKVPSEAGAHHFAAKTARESGQVQPQPKKARKPKAPASCELVFSSTILDCVQRVLGGEIDVCVGDAKVNCKARKDPNTFQSEHLRGNVFVSECLYPGEWLPKLAKLRATGAIDQLVVALPAQTADPWLRALAEGDWVCCFPTNVQPPLVLAHLGHHHGFEVMFGQVGLVVRPVDLRPSR